MTWDNTPRGFTPIAEKPKQQPPNYRRRLLSYFLSAVAVFCGLSMFISFLTPDTPPIPTIAALPSLTPTITPTFTPTATITDTPIPTITPLPTATTPFTVTPNSVIDTPNRTYYVETVANVRDCPQRSCNSFGELTAGTVLISNGFISGEEVNAGNVIWYQVEFNGQIAYVYSELVSTTPPSAPASNGNVGNTSTIPNQPNISPVVGASPNCAGFDWGSCTNYAQPANCDDAVAKGIPDRAAACCFPKLDRDDDGVACYGD